ncbi:MAG: TorF family putative porin [Pseudomonadota bacterium]
MRFSHISLGALALAIATPALADPIPATAADPIATAPAAPADPVVAADPAAPVATLDDAAAPPPAFTVTGGITAISDYRFRGLTQSDEKLAVQATINVNSALGFYVGTWASTIDGGPDGSTPLLTDYGVAEVDLYAGYTKTFSGVGVDVGLLYYYYPGGGAGLKTDFFEPYASINYTIGPVNAKIGGNYAWGGQSGLNFTPGSDDNIYVYGELAGGIPKTPVTLKAHVGYTNGSLGLANFTTSDTYWDWSLTAEAVLKGHFKIGVSYVDTDITDRSGFYSKGSGSTFKSGTGKFSQFYGRGATVLGYIGFTF